MLLAQLLHMSAAQLLAQANYMANGMPIDIVDAHDDSGLVGFEKRTVFRVVFRAATAPAGVGQS